MNKLNELIRDFKEKYPKMDYFTMDSLIWYIDAAYCIGHDEAMQVQARNEKEVIRSDGKEYRSITRAANDNKVSETAIRKAILNGHKSAGYHWKIYQKLQT